MLGVGLFDLLVRFVSLVWVVGFGSRTTSWVDEGLRVRTSVEHLDALLCHAHCHELMDRRFF